MAKITAQQVKDLRDETSGSPSASDNPITSKPIFQKIIGFLIIIGILALVGYLLYKGGAVQKIPFLKAFLSKR